MLNSTKAKPKRSDVEKKLSTMVFIIFIILVIFCLFTALYARIGLQLNTVTDEFSTKNLTIFCSLPRIISISEIVLLLS